VLHLDGGLQGVSWLPLVGKIAATASWVIAAFYDLPSLNEITTISAPNLHP
jgi:hypothetical protein